jgi:hypothetical protein
MRVWHHFRDSAVSELSAGAGAGGLWDRARPTSICVRVPGGVVTTSPSINCPNAGVGLKFIR